MRWTTGILLFGIVMLSLWTGCGKKGLDPEAARNAVVSTQAYFAESIRKGDAAAASSVYAADAQLISPGSPPKVGRDAIREDFVGMIKAGVNDLQLETLQVWGDAGYLIEEGRFLLKDNNGKELEHGRYLTAWKQENGQWKIFRDIWNSFNSAQK
jgi:uncharacterized protein (TIGR02246 family)